MVVSKRDKQRCEIGIGDVRIKHVQKFNYQGCLVINDGKYGTEIRSHIRIASDAFIKAKQHIKRTEIFVTKKKGVLN